MGRLEMRSKLNGDSEGAQKEVVRQEREEKDKES